MIEDKLNLTYYSGTDLYSDGDVENELLSVVQEDDNYEEHLMKSDSWAHLYHLSNIRENILDWYDFNPNGSLLEIGSGCGALSGLFCRKVDHVVAIELSKRRSTINATRNDKYNNLTIMLGNFEDIQLEEKFDYVTLIGVFEYSICYINSENPFMDMLAKAKSFLKPGGKLIIAIENKYGLKYFAGASEDHSGRVFDGIENYTAVDRVRTFSKKALVKMLEDAGFTNNEFFYPMPDYKLPSEVYSTRHLPQRGSIRSACVSYDRDRYELFDERLAFDSICEDGMFEDFANSFLIISDDNTAVYNGEYVEYAKYNRLRAPQYQISTKIVTGYDGIKRVEKEALRSEAVEHISALTQNAYKLANAGGHVVPINIISNENGKAVFPYIKGCNLSDMVSSCLGNKDKLIEAMHNALDLIYGDARHVSALDEEDLVSHVEDFILTEDFIGIFGKPEDPFILETMKSLFVSNVDSILSNFVQLEDGMVISLDYEWVYDFPIPVDYLKYRTVYYFYSENRAYIERQINEIDFLAEFGITEDMIKVFAAMDDNFQQYVHGKDRKYIYTANYSKMVTNIGKNLQNSEPWFMSIMKDLNDLNNNMGPHRRDLVDCHISTHRKNEFIDKWTNRLKNPGRSYENLMKRLTDK